MSNKDKLKSLNELLGSYKAEWLKGDIFNFFAEPTYFTALQDNRPCVLEGGRGTGKTTVLRGLSYQGQFALHSNDLEEFDKKDFIGIYHRVNTNHVRSFVGGDVSIENWLKVYSHYFNLIICKEILGFVQWHKDKSSSDTELTSEHCNLIAKSINIDSDCSSLKELLKFLDLEIIALQSGINNISDEVLPNLSMAGAPINLVTEKVVNLDQFNNKMVFIILDEYENFENYQQELMNTFIKHNSEHYTFKIGVRELGWRVKHTLNKEELLHDPADYVLIEIEKKFRDSHFSQFAKKVCEQRIRKLLDIKDQSAFSIESSLGNLSIDDEAELLEVEKTEYYQDYHSLTKSIKKKIQDLPKLYIFFISYWAKWHDMSFEEAISDYIKNKNSWDTRFDNYKYEMLFKIRKGRGKSGIQKYYSGWGTFIKMANGNIRYLMELVYRAYEKHLQEDHDINAPLDAKTQTVAAQEVGQKNLMELEGLWKNGAQLTKLLLGFGRVFQILSSAEGKSAPEVNQFSIENSSELSDECKEIISAAVMNLALVRSPGNKLSSVSHTRDYLYTVHPIFSAFFVFSYRRKRKMVIGQDDILGIISTPRNSINRILKSNKVDTSQKKLPNQLEMFENYYND